MRATGRKVEMAKLKIKNKLETLSNAALTPSYPLSLLSPSPRAHHLPVMSVGAMTMTLIMTERMETTKAQTEQNENVDNGEGDEERESEREKRTLAIYTNSTKRTMRDNFMLTQHKDNSRDKVRDAERKGERETGRARTRMLKIIMRCEYVLHEGAL